MDSGALNSRQTAAFTFIFILQDSIFL